jgi:hypothetical protein
MDMKMDAAAAFTSKRIQDCDCRSSQRQKGRKAQLARNIKTMGIVSSSIAMRLVKKA